MRGHGVVGTDSLEASDHVCWSYDDARDFFRPAVEWLRAGLERGQRLLYISNRDHDRMRRELAPLPDVDGLLARGALRLQSLADAYEVGAPLVPAAQLEVYAAATRDARRDGYAGLRVLADGTALATDPARLDALRRWEHLADEWMSANAMDAMCAYRRGVVADDVLADLAVVHPAAHVPDRLAPFHLYFDDGRLMLVGSVDDDSIDRFQRALADSHLGAGEIRLDVRGLHFVGTRGVAALAHWGRSLRETNGRLSIDGGSDLLRQLWSLPPDR